MEKSHEFPDDNINTVGSARFRCPKMLFQPSLMDKEASGVHVTTSQSSMKCDFDTRKSLYIELRVAAVVHQVLMSDAPLNSKANHERMIQIVFEALNVPALCAAIVKYPIEHGIATTSQPIGTTFEKIWYHISSPDGYFLRSVVSNDMDPKIAKWVVDRSSTRERDYLKTTSHRITTSSWHCVHSFGALSRIP